MYCRSATEILQHRLPGEKFFFGVVLIRILPLEQLPLLLAAERGRQKFKLSSGFARERNVKIGRPERTYGRSGKKKKMTLQ